MRGFKLNIRILSGILRPEDSLIILTIKELFRIFNILKLFLMINIFKIIRGDEFVIFY